MNPGLLILLVLIVLLAVYGGLAVSPVLWLVLVLAVLLAAFSWGPHRRW